MKNKTKKQGAAPAVKKLFSLLLALVILIGVTMCVNFSAFAAGWADYAQDIELDILYEDSCDYTDYHTKGGDYYDAYKFTVPVKGNISIYVECEDWNNRWHDYYIYKNNETIDEVCDLYAIAQKYNSGMDIYYGSQDVKLSAGDYYLCVKYRRSPGSVYGAHNVKLSFKPSLTTPVLKATTGTSSVKLPWNKSAGASGYQLQQYKNSQWTTIKNTTATSYSISSLKSYTSYKFRLRAYVKADGKNYYGSWVSKSALTRLATPKAKIAANSNGGFKISWNKIAGADKYQVYYDNGSGYKHFKTVTGTSLTLGTTTYGKKYSFKVRALKSSNSAITSAFSNAVTGTNTKKLQTPSGVKLKKNKNGSFTISWSKVTGANKYQVYLYDTKTKKYKLYKTTTSANVTTGKATKGKTYQYKIRAVRNNNSKATSAFSGVVRGKR